MDSCADVEGADEDSDVLDTVEDAFDADALAELAAIAPEDGNVDSGG